MIYVARDAAGLRMVLDQMLEREHDEARLASHLEGKDEAYKRKLLAGCTQVTLSPGYERWAFHLMLLERMHKLGLPPGELLAVEVSGLEILDRARGAHRYKHPTCFACGMPQDNRFLIECMDCGARFRRRGK